MGPDSRGRVRGRPPGLGPALKPGLEPGPDWPRGGTSRASGPADFGLDGPSEMTRGRSRSVPSSE